MLNLVVDPKQPSRAKLPMVAGSRSGTRLSAGEGDDDTGVVGDTPPGGPPEAAGTEGKDCIGLFAEVADPEGGGTGLTAGPEAEFVGGVAIGPGTEPSPGVLGATTAPVELGAPTMAEPDGETRPRL